MTIKVARICFLLLPEASHLFLDLLPFQRRVSVPALAQLLELRTQLDFRLWSRDIVTGIVSFFLCGLPLKLGVRKLTKTINLMETKWDLARLEWFGRKVRLNSFSWAPNKNKTFGSLASSNAAQKVLAFKSIIPVRIWPELNEISCSGRQSIAA